MPRVDIPAKVTGGVAYVQDLRLPGMVHARVVRPPSYGARLRSVDTSAVERMPGVLKVVRDGSFLAVIAEREFQAVKAMDALALACRWDESRPLPTRPSSIDWLRSAPSREHVIHEQRTGSATAERHDAGGCLPASLPDARIDRPVLRRRALRGGALTVWTHSQGVYPLRAALAEMLRLPQDQVHCIHMEGSGCYGHNGADDVAADAALLAVALPGRPVRVQWMRDQEHAWEPFGAAMVTSVRASLDAQGAVADWHYEVWSNAHSTRPGGAGNLMPAWHLADPFTQPTPEPIPQPTGGGDRNAIPLYRFANTRIVHHFIPDMPLRVSALRGARRLHERVRDRELHGRAGEGGRRRSGRIPPTPPARCSRTRRHRAGSREVRLERGGEAARRDAAAASRFAQLQEPRCLHGRGGRARGRARDRPRAA